MTTNLLIHMHMRVAYTRRILMRWCATMLAGTLLGMGSMPSLAAPVASPSASVTPTALAWTPSPSFSPPRVSDIPDSPFGEVVRQGERIFNHTPKYAPEFVGNNLNCASCHLDAGRRADSAPMWAAYVIYPAYRSKNGHVNTLAERLQGCFRFSMNGKAPDAQDDVLVALQTYMFWLASKAPTGVKLSGQGYPKLQPPPIKADYVRGQEVYARSCALCHGANGAGQKAQGDRWAFPPLWGPESFNWGAGMHQLGNAAGFIKANMPLSQGGMLTDQEAWDVAYFMNAHERPQDPRFKDSVAATRKKYHDDDDSLYGLSINGAILGEHSPPAGGKLNH